MNIEIGMKGEAATLAEREDTALEVGSGSLLVYATPCMAALMEAAADTQNFNASLSQSEEDKVLDELRSSGCNVVDVDDKTPWVNACQKVIEDNTKDQAELYQKIAEML